MRCVLRLRAGVFEFAFGGSAAAGDVTPKILYRGFLCIAMRHRAKRLPTPPNARPDKISPAGSLASLRSFAFGATVLAIVGLIGWRGDKIYPGSLGISRHADRER